MTKMLSVQAVRLLLCLTGSLSFMPIASGQEPENYPTPLDDITERSVVANHQILTYQPIREADILWEKRLWRIVDVREKMNQSFTAPESPCSKSSLMQPLMVRSLYTPLKTTDLQNALRWIKLKANCLR